ncbi:hypothetical protein LAZ67_6001697 [Cordylochernes scorpioides]|uniref:Sulfotransferase domain-containing protein n=1 Tax=Cordylochernes scorpioides TaxID=51811 RepID=A0ABY6KJZ3_9ARAC|nr:hypothetical protein LAZ67_6001697 [Cordylochernes scorpioides]
MKEDLKTSILMIAGFLDENLERLLLEDSEMLMNVIKYSSVEECRKVIQIEKLFRSKQDDQMPRRSTDFTFVRKGIVGDWRNYLNQEQSERFNKKAKEFFQGLEVYEYWKSLGIF